MSARRTEILFLALYDTRAVVCGERYIESPAHVDTQVRVFRVDDGSTEVDTTAGDAETNVVIDGLSLEAGTLYRVRMRYQDSDLNWGGWSRNAYARPQLDLGYTAIAVNDEPASGGELPVAPSFPEVIERRRDMREHVLETGHVSRRPVHAIERRTMRFRWTRIGSADRTTLLAFLDARIAAVESFATGLASLGSRTFFARRGSYRDVLVAPGTYDVELEADEVFPP